MVGHKGAGAQDGIESKSESRGFWGVDVLWVESNDNGDIGVGSDFR